MRETWPIEIYVTIQRDVRNVVATRESQRGGDGQSDDAHGEVFEFADIFSAGKFKGGIDGEIRRVCGLNNYADEIGATSRLQPSSGCLFETFRSTDTVDSACVPLWNTSSAEIRIAAKLLQSQGFK